MLKAFSIFIYWEMKKVQERLDTQIANLNNSMRARGMFGDYLKQMRRMHGDSNFYDSMLRKYEENKQSMLEELTLLRLEHEQ